MPAWQAALLCLSALAIGFGTAWLIGQRSIGTIRERAATAEGKADSLQQQLTATIDGLETARQVTQDQAALLARAHAERDSAFEKAAKAESTVNDVQQRALMLESRLSEAQRLTVEKNGDFEVATQTITHLQDQCAQRDKLVTQFTEESQARVAAIQELQYERVQLRERVSALEAANAQKAEQIELQKRWVNDQSDHLKTFFAKTASDLLENKAVTFGQVNREQIEALMKPFGDQLLAFRSRVDELHTLDTAARAKLEEQVSNLARGAAAVGATADNLAKAMLGSPKKQGDWGEHQLNVLLEQAGFIRGKHFDIQVSARDDDDVRRFADTVLRMPERQCLVIDAKVTLSSWIEYCSATEPSARDRALGDVVRSLRSHYQNVAMKDYAQAVSPGQSLPFTLMFIPIEAAAIEAFRAAPDLFSDAQKRKVIMVTPTTLFCVLQLVQALWNVHDRQANALQIAEHGRLLLRKLGTFVESFCALGDRLGAALESYDAAKGQLHMGRGNLASIAARMSNLGIEFPRNGKLAELIASDLPALEKDATGTTSNPEVV